MMRKKSVLAAALLGTAIVLSGCKKSEPITFSQYSQYKEIDTPSCVTVGDYKGMKITKDSFTISDSDIENKLNSVLYENGSYQESAQKEIGKGDKVTISTLGMIDGKKNDGFTSNHYEFVYGDGEHIMDGFTAKLEKACAGEVLSFDLVVPSTFSEAQLVGKTVAFQVTIDSVSEYIVPKLSDEFIQSISDSKTVEEYKKTLVPVIRDDKMKKLKDDSKNGVWQLVADMSEVSDYPESAVTAMNSKLKEVMDMYAKMYGLETEDYMKQYYGMSFDEYVTMAVKQELLMDAIGRKENISITEKEYKDGLSKYAQTYGYNDTDAMIEKIGEDKIKQAMLWDKVKEYVLSQVSIAED